MRGFSLSWFTYLLLMVELQKLGIENEIHLRGTTLTISAIFERNLLHIILFSHPKYLREPKGEPMLVIKNLTFGGKFKRVKELLQLHHADLLIKYETLLKDLDHFKEIRNKLAHCEIRWKDEKLEDLEIWDVVIENKLQFTAPENYTNTGLNIRLINSMNKIEKPLFNLQLEVQDRFQQIDRSLFAALLSANDG